MKVLEAFGEPVADGGQEAFVFGILQKMDRAGLEVDFLTAYDWRSDHYRKLSKELGGSAYSLKLPFIPGRSRSNIIRPFRTFLKKHSYDVIHIHSGSISVLTIMAAEADRAGVKKVIVHSHCTGDRDDLKHRILRYLASLSMRRHVDVYAACSHIAANWKFEPAYARKAVIIKNGIDKERFSYDAERRKTIRSELGASEKFIIGHVGRFCYQKNQAFLIRILEAAVKADPDTILLLVGDGEERHAIELLVKKKGLSRKVIFTGTVENVEDYLQAMDVFVFPSRFEGLGIAAVEAQCAGLPAVLSDSLPREAGLSERAVFLSLEDSPEKWANTARMIFKPRRNQQTSLIQGAGYDIRVTAAEVRKLYF